MIESDNGRPRTFTREDWTQANEKLRPRPENIPTVLTKCMAELQLPLRSQSGLGSHHPWPRWDDPLQGVMWIGVPHIVDYWLEEGGGAWIIQVRGRSGRPSEAYLRLCPSPPDEEVQFGFCPMQVNHLPKLVERKFPGGMPDLSHLCVQSRADADCRVDQITLAVTSLGQPKNITPVACEFRRLLQDTLVSDFLEDLLRHLFTDGEGYNNLLEGRDQTYRRLATLAVVCAYPDFFKPHDIRSLGRFTLFLGLLGEEWTKSYVWPIYYNVSMPEELFESAGRSLERGIPPLVPQYVFPAAWMFNDHASDPCSGIQGVSHITGVGRKILAGVVNRFNLDSPGRVSYWPFEMSPPAEWRAKVVDCAESIQSKRMPLDLLGRGDFVLSEARQIPIFFCQDRNLTKFARLTKLVHSGNGDVLLVETGLCDAAGQLIPDTASKPVEEITEEEPEAERRADFAECSNCITRIGESNGSCLCVDCDTYLCDNCMEDHTCDQGDA